MVAAVMVTLMLLIPIVSFYTVEKYRSRLDEP